MQYTKHDIKQLDWVTKIKVINSVTGIKPANLIGTISNNGKTNVAIFSSVVHLGSDPALIGFIVRPSGEIPRHTYNNILQNGYYTINHIHPEFSKKAHYTSAKLDVSISEFDRCNLSEEYITNFKAPFVKESNFKIGMRFKEAIDISLNDTILVIGEIEHLILPENAIINNDVNLETTNSVGISGLNSYYSLNKIASYPYARASEVPEF
ncbi:flavin reductase family protein [Tenacibaculum aestuariivivum]|uniref:flavin reductase family protein n=1 Tax=Tenacibaculum aestuariivivum TaxID=2006131 RepID=UPI003AB2F9E3